MASYTGGALTICPYYIREKGCEIICEGVINGTQTIIPFGSSKAKADYQQNCCFDKDGAACCLLAVKLNEKYREQQQRPARTVELRLCRQCADELRDTVKGFSMHKIGRAIYCEKCKTRRYGYYVRYEKGARP